MLSDYEFEILPRLEELGVEILRVSHGYRRLTLELDSGLCVHFEENIDRNRLDCSFYQLYKGGIPRVLNWPVSSLNVDEKFDGEANRIGLHCEYVSRKDVLMLDEAIDVLKALKNGV